MRTSSILPLALACALAGACALAVACAGTPPKGSPQELAGTPPPPRPWTSAFQREALLMADEIEIEGPSDLVDHVVLRQDDETSEYVTKTISEGLLQRLVARPEMGVPVQANLDGWALAAFREIRVLQRPGDVPVVVRARGQAFWAEASSGGERRENMLEFRGERGR